MAKVNFSKVEKSFDLALQKLLIDNLSELATIVDVVEEKDKKISSEALQEIIAKFQKQLFKIKEQDPALFNKLNLTKEEENRLSLPTINYVQSDWIRLKELKIRIDELKHALYGQENTAPLEDAQIEKETKRHLNKRFNIRDGWLPLK